MFVFFFQNSDRFPLLWCKTDKIFGDTLLKHLEAKHIDDEIALVTKCETKILSQFPVKINRVYKLYSNVEYAFCN